MYIAGFEISDLFVGIYSSQVVRSLICMCLISLCGFIKGVRSIQFAVTVHVCEVCVCGFIYKMYFALQFMCIFPRWWVLLFL